MTRIAVMGSGSWGTAFAMVLADAGSEVVMWCRDPKVAEGINARHRNEAYHPGIDLPASIKATADARVALEQAGIYRLPVTTPRPAFPRPLAQLLNVASLDDLAWKKKAPGVAIFDVRLPAAARGQLKLLRIGAGRAMPEHGHGGEEITMVLKGAYRDHMGRFAAGDVADLDEDIEHRPVVEQDGDCICLVATERPTRFKSLAARIMQPFVGI